MIGSRIKQLRTKRDVTQKELADFLGLTPKMISFYELGGRFPPHDIISRLSDYFGVSTDYILGRTDNPAPPASFESVELASFPIIGSIAAGYGGTAIEDYTGDFELIPVSELRGHDRADFFVLRVSGNSMYPQFLNGDSVLVQRCTSVDSGSIAVVMYNGDEATIKKVVYVYGEDWFELIPINPEYETKRVEGQDLEECRVLGKVIKLLRNI